MKLLPLIVTAFATVCLGSTTVLAQDTTCHSLVIQVVQTFPEIPTVDDTGLVRAKNLCSSKRLQRPGVHGVWKPKSSTRHFKQCGCVQQPERWITNEGIAVQYLNDAAYVNDSYVTLGQFTQTAGNPGNANNTISARHDCFPKEVWSNCRDQCVDFHVR